MNRTRKSKHLSWSELAVVAMLGGLVLFGLAAIGLAFLQSLVSIGFGAAMLLLAWLWELSFRRAETARPLTRRQRAWNAAVLVAWLAVMGVLAWWYAAGHPERTQEQLPATKPSTLPEGPTRGMTLNRCLVTRVHKRQGCASC